MRSKTFFNGALTVVHPADYFKSMSALQLTLWLACGFAAVVMFAFGHTAEGLMIANGPLVAPELEALANEFKAKSNELKTSADDLKLMHKELSAKTDTNDKTLKDIKSTVDDFLAKHNGIAEVVRDLEQRLAEGAKNSENIAQSWGQQFVNSQNFKSASEGGSLSAKRGTIGCEVKQVNSTAAGGLIRSARENDVVSLAKERRVVRDLLRTVPVATSSVDYAIQTTRTNNAAPVAEAAAKPYSDFAWSSATVVVRTLAHLAKITRQAMDDAPRLMGEIDSEMRYGLGYVEERQFLYGTGVGQNLHGIIPQATEFARAAGVGAQTGMTRVDVLRFAILNLALRLTPADGLVLNELDWALIELQKTDDGAYLFAQPQGVADRRMWGLPVVATPAINAGDFLAGAFGIGATVYDRMAVEVLISTENADDFEKNLATVRAEERVAIAVKRPGAFETGTFSEAITALQAA